MTHALLRQFVLDKSQTGMGIYEKVHLRSPHVPSLPDLAGKVPRLSLCVNPVLSPIGGSLPLCHSIYERIRSNRSSRRPIWRLARKAKSSDSSLARTLGASCRRHRSTSSGRHRLERRHDPGFRKGPSPNRLAADSGDWRCDGGYIKDGRPQLTPMQCLSDLGSVSGPRDSTAISMLVARRCAGQASTARSRGAAHVLRHSVASSMLRQGASLQEIAGVLRHRSIATTEIYAKVDVLTLRQVAQPWPEVKSC